MNFSLQIQTKLLLFFDDHLIWTPILLVEILSYFGFSAFLRLHSLVSFTWCQGIWLRQVSSPRIDRSCSIICWHAQNSFLCILDEIVTCDGLCLFILLCIPRRPVTGLSHSCITGGVKRYLFLFINKVSCFFFFSGTTFSDNPLNFCCLQSIHLSTVSSEKRWGDQEWGSNTLACSCKPSTRSAPVRPFIYRRGNSQKTHTKSPSSQWHVLLFEQW